MNEGRWRGKCSSCDPEEKTKQGSSGQKRFRTVKVCRLKTQTVCFVLHSGKSLCVCAVLQVLLAVSKKSLESLPDKHCSSVQDAHLWGMEKQAGWADSAGKKEWERGGDGAKYKWKEDVTNPRSVGLWSTWSCVITHQPSKESLTTQASTFTRQRRLDKNPAAERWRNKSCRKRLLVFGMGLNQLPEIQSISENKIHEWIVVLSESLSFFFSSG